MTWLLCVSNEGYKASLQARKLYQRIEDAASEEMGFVRVIDETGEDYAFPETLFSVVDIAPLIEARLLAA
jgi:hypothetical protein